MNSTILSCCECDHKQKLICNTLPCPQFALIDCPTGSESNWEHGLAKVAQPQPVSDQQYSQLAPSGPYAIGTPSMGVLNQQQFLVAGPNGTYTIVAGGAQSQQQQFVASGPNGNYTMVAPYTTVAPSVATLDTPYVQQHMGGYSAPPTMGYTGQQATGFTIVGPNYGAVREQKKQHTSFTQGPRDSYSSLGAASDSGFSSNVSDDDTGAAAVPRKRKKKGDQQEPQEEKVLKLPTPVVSDL